MKLSAVWTKIMEIRPTVMRISISFKVFKLCVWKAYFDTYVPQFSFLCLFCSGTDKEFIVSYDTLTLFFSKIDFSPHFVLLLVLTNNGNVQKWAVQTNPYLIFCFRMKNNIRLKLFFSFFIEVETEFQLEKKRKFEKISNFR